MHVINTQEGGDHTMDYTSLVQEYNDETNLSRPKLTKTAIVLLIMGLILIITYLYYIYILVF